jgi:hypothetical protein
VSAVQTDRVAAAAAAKQGSAAIRKLADRRSRGSDVTGCVLALANMLGPDSDLLVVSDLQDTRFTAPRDSRVAGSLTGVRLWIAQSCPSGIPRKCQRQIDLFLRRLQPLGLSADRVTVQRPEQLSATVRGWVGR